MSMSKDNLDDGGERKSGDERANTLRLISCFSLFFSFKFCFCFVFTHFVSVFPAVRGNSSSSVRICHNVREYSPH